jgi:hypothetical protein
MFYSFGGNNSIIEFVFIFIGINMEYQINGFLLFSLLFQFKREFVAAFDKFFLSFFLE